MATFDFFPLWVFLILVVLASIICTECGYRIGERLRKKSGHGSSAPLATIVASILGLLAFMLGFTFNVALSRFDERRIAILDDANAIGTTYLRADFFDEPQKGQIKKLLHEYALTRSRGMLDGAEMDALLVKSQAQQNQLWTIAATLGKERPNPITGLFISSLNDTIDMHAKRVDIGIRARVPISVWLVLFAVSILSMLGVGYYFGLSGSRSWAETIILVSTFALVMVLVTDLDRPHEGTIKASQQPMLDLIKQME
jgi:CDP-diglyceride synthetase